MTAPQSITKQYDFVRNLQQATGVFFSGGDQSLIMDTFQIPGGSMVQRALVEAYHNGIVFGGTSAGTAIMSRNMITGSIQDDGQVPIGIGLGFLPPHVIVDQHFSQRDREARLLRAKTQSGTKIGIGIDEDTAIIVRNKSEIRVDGDHSVRIDRELGNIYTEKNLKPATPGRYLTTDSPKIDPQIKNARYSTSRSKLNLDRTNYKPSSRNSLATRCWFFLGFVVFCLVSFL